MFCPSCGFEYTQKTNYCKRCGEELNQVGAADAPKKRQPNVNGMFWAVIAFCLSAMALLYTVYDYFHEKPWSNGERFGPVVLGGAFTLIVALLLIWQLARMVTAFRRTGQKVTVEKHFIREVPTVQRVAPTGQMPEAPEAIYSPSVIEHTTRQMAGVHGEPKAVK
jgi:hypothetical protein